MSAPTEPVPVAPVPVRRSYRGGAALAAFHGRAGVDGDRPEEWLASTVASSKPERDGVGAGLCRLPDGRLLADAIADDPEGWLGAAHHARFGADPRVLVKLLDAGERLTIQAHPDDALGRTLGASCGKSEAWLVLAARRPDALLHIGLREPVAAEELRALIAGRDTPALLGLLNAVPAVAGELHYIPAGLVHAIGDGVLLVEVEQPSDVTFHLEWEGRVERERAHLGLGWDGVVAALDLGAHAPRPGMPPQAADQFWIDTLAEAPGRFAILVATGGEGTLNGRPARRGDVFVISAAVGELSVTGDLTVARCLGPEPR